MSATANGIDKMWQTLVQMANDQFETAPFDQNAIIKGARESLIIDRVYRGHLADMLEALP
jgi:hypothetical protein